MSIKEQSTLEENARTEKEVCLHYSKQMCQIHEGKKKDKEPNSELRNVCKDLKQEGILIKIIQHRKVKLSHSLAVTLQAK